MTPDLKDKAQEWSAKLKNLAAKVPGLNEFMGREKIREQDKILREHTAKKLDEVKGAIDGVKKRLLEKMQIGLLPELDRLTQQVDRLRDKQRFAAHGYAGVFDENQVNEPELVKLYEGDMKILEKVDAIQKGCDLLCAAEIDEQMVKAKLAELKGVLNELAGLIDNRGDSLKKIGL